MSESNDAALASPVEQPTAVEPSVQPASVQAASVQPSAVEPAVQPVPVQTAPVQPAPVEPSAAEPAVQPVPVQPAPVQTAPVQQVPVQTAPVQPVPVQTAPGACPSLRAHPWARQLRTRRGTLGAAGVGLALLTVLTFRLATHGVLIEVAAGGRPLRMALTSGDIVVAGAGTQLEIRAQEPALRELRLLAGNALFDVKRLGPQQRFVVHTKVVDVLARGTVFSVEVLASPARPRARVDGGRTLVRVYEGRVQIDQRSLGAGEVWLSPGPALPLARDPLAADGLAAAALRNQTAAQARPAPRLVVSALPDVQPVVAKPEEAVQEPEEPPALQELQEIVPTGPRVPAAISLEQARAWLREGDSERALLAALSSDHAEQPAWLLLEADALTAQRRHGEAVDTYQLVAELEPSLRTSAGYAGAALAFYELRDAVRALLLLDGLGLDDADSPLRERATALRVEALLWLGRRDEAEVAAQRYLAHEPDTEVSPRLRELGDDALP